MTRPDHRQIDGQDQHGRADSLRARHQVLRVSAVAHHIKLKPRRRISRLRHLFDAADRDGRLDERHADRLRCPCSLHLRTGREHPGEPDRCQHDRERQLLPEYLDSRIADTDVTHDDLAEQHGCEVGDVRAHRGLLVGPAVDVVEQLTRQPPSRQLAVVEHRRRSNVERPVTSVARQA
jgi:hypothetical protein